MTEREKHADRVAGLVREMVTGCPPEAVRERMDEILARFRSDLAAHPYVRKLERAGRITAPRATPRLLELRMGRIVVAAAAVLLIVLGGIALQSQFSRPLVWAEVVDRVGGIDRLMLEMQVTVGSEEHALPSMTFYLSSDLGFRWDVHSEGHALSSFYLPAESDSLIVVSHEEKLWFRLPAAVESPVPGPLSLDEEPAAYLSRFLARGWRELGQSTIDGVVVEGIEVDDPPARIGEYLDGTGRLWVEMRSELPFRLELEGTVEGQQLEWIFNFRWGEQVAREAFTPVIPPDYTRLYPPSGD